MLTLISLNYVEGIDRPTTIELLPLLEPPEFVAVNILGSLTQMRLENRFIVRVTDR